MSRLLLCIALAGCGGAPPPPVEAATSAALAPCPASPNCVSSQADPSDAEHHTAPLSLHGDPADAVDRLARIIRSHERTRITHTDDRVLRATYTSRVFRFVDDVELRIDAEAGLVHVRSASRVGYDDLEANPERVARIRADWDAAR